MAKVLIIDDNPDNLRVAATVINNAGYEVMLALTGKEGLACATHNRPDIILLDIMMPEMNGYEVCRKLKENEHTSEIPVLFVSARDEIKDIKRAFDVGGVDHIAKPFVPEILAVRVNNQLEHFRLMKNLSEREKMFKNLFRSIKQPIALIDSNYIIKYCNLEFSSVFELSPNMAIGRNCFEVTCGGKSKCSHCPLATTFQANETAYLVKNYKGRVYRAETSPVSFENNHMKYASLTLTDISDFTV
ncbi:response regulator [Sedimentisphaera salicampi]|uniref:Stalked cell differentiation-controlling protein n=1 Tax=Sedimentisphaera salicampi TaxID=1941349 RepID=A0A1W6LJF1_9BACT|nr:response regulator [Sedimentisphaera salicampi]ARN55918.1 Stalked cell differentiation-controlling protein [Sedimentisphaera salicampi]OXU16109.1 Stalked cell differentiation-controlling protein [Sedimentisphaera salicampi]